MATENGKDYRIYVTSGSSVIAGETTSSITINGTPIDTSSKDSDWNTAIMGSKSWEVSGSFTYDNTAGAEQEDMFYALSVGSLVEVFWGKVTTATRTRGFTGNALITSISLSAERDGVVTKDITFTGTGAVTPIPTTTTTGA